jgi:hypothetical protein
MRAGAHERTEVAVAAGVAGACCHGGDHRVDAFGQVGGSALDRGLDRSGFSPHLVPDAVAAAAADTVAADDRTGPGRSTHWPTDTPQQNRRNSCAQP